MARKHQTLPLTQEIVSGSVGGLLAALWRRIMHDIGLTDLARYNALMERYVQKALLDPNRVEKATARASLSKELLKVSMTWKTFIKGLSFLNVIKFELKIKLHHANGKTTEHNLNVALEDIEIFGSEKDDDD